MCVWCCLSAVVALGVLVLPQTGVAEAAPAEQPLSGTSDSKPTTENPAVESAKVTAKTTELDTDNGNTAEDHAPGSESADDRVPRIPRISASSGSSLTQTEVQAPSNHLLQATEPVLSNKPASVPLNLKKQIAAMSVGKNVNSVEPLPVAAPAAPGGSTHPEISSKNHAALTEDVTKAQLHENSDTHLIQGTQVIQDTVRGISIEEVTRPVAEYSPAEKTVEATSHLIDPRLQSTSAIDRGNPESSLPLDQTKAEPTNQSNSKSVEHLDLTRTESAPALHETKPNPRYSIEEANKESSNPLNLPKTESTPTLDYTKPDPTHAIDYSKTESTHPLDFTKTDSASLDQTKPKPTTFIGQTNTESRPPLAHTEPKPISYVDQANIDSVPPIEKLSPQSALVDHTVAESHKTSLSTDIKVGLAVPETTVMLALPPISASVSAEDAVTPLPAPTLVRVLPSEPVSMSVEPGSQQDRSSPLAMHSTSPVKHPQADEHKGSPDESINWKESMPVEISLKPADWTSQADIPTKDRPAAEINAAPVAGENKASTSPEEMVAERSISETPTDQPLTTVITPLHAIPSEVDRKDTLDDAITTPSASGNQNINIIPISKKQDPPDVGNNTPNAGIAKENNAYTITANQFAEKTAIAHAEKSDAELISSHTVSETTPVLPNSPAENSEDGKILKTAVHVSEGDTSNNKPNQSSGQNKDEENTKIGEPKPLIDKTSESETHRIERLQNTEPQITQDNEASTTSSLAENTNSMSLSELSSKMTSEINSYSVDLANRWNERKEKISWLGEAAGVLKDYSDKIKIGHFNDKCITKDEENYEKRKQTLNDVIKSCESELKRVDWHDLQEKTKEILSKIQEIVRGASKSINDMPKEDPHFNEKKLVIENEAKRKLLELNIESVKDMFSNLKDKSLQVDEEEYDKCISGRPEKSLITETRLDIMRIYGCVG